MSSRSAWAWSVWLTRKAMLLAHFRKRVSQRANTTGLEVRVSTPDAFYRLFAVQAFPIQRIRHNLIEHSRRVLPMTLCVVGELGLALG